jgi:outer membrane protein assembly factor BamB
MKARLPAIVIALLAAGCGPASPALVGPLQTGKGAPVTLLTLPPSPPIAAEPPPADDPSIPLEAGAFSLYHGDPARTGRADVEPIKKPAIRWHARVGIQGWLDAPLVAGALVIVPSSGTRHNASDDRDGVVALGLATGKPVWEAHFPIDANGAAIAGDRVIAGADDGQVRALDLRSGRQIWAQPLGGKVYAGPLPLGDRVIVGDATGAIRALALDTGSTLWKAQLDGEIRGGASTDGRAIFAASQGGEIAAFRYDGAEIWRAHLNTLGSYTGPAQIYAAPMVVGSRLFVPFARDTYYDDPAVVALDTRTGKPVWEAKNNIGISNWGNVRFTPALSEGRLVYAEPYSGDIVGLDAGSGAVTFRTAAGPCFFPSWASPAAARDVVYVPRFDGAVYAVRARTGVVLWQMYLGEEQRAGPKLPPKLAAQQGCEWEVPSGHALYAPAAIAADGTLLVGSGEGVLWALGEDPR